MASKNSKHNYTSGAGRLAQRPIPKQIPESEKQIDLIGNWLKVDVREQFALHIPNKATLGRRRHDIYVHDLPRVWGLFQTHRERAISEKKNIDERLQLTIGHHAMRAASYATEGFVWAGLNNNLPLDKLLEITDTQVDIQLVLFKQNLGRLPSYAKLADPIRIAVAQQEKSDTYGQPHGTFKALCALATTAVMEQGLVGRSGFILPEPGQTLKVSKQWQMPANLIAPEA